MTSEMILCVKKLKLHLNVCLYNLGMFVLIVFMFLHLSYQELNSASAGRGTTSTIVGQSEGERWQTGLQEVLHVWFVSDYLTQNHIHTPTHTYIHTFTHSQRTSPCLHTEVHNKNQICTARSGLGEEEEEGRLQVRRGRQWPRLCWLSFKRCFRRSGWLTVGGGSPAGFRRGEEGWGGKGGRPRVEIQVGVGYKTKPAASAWGGTSRWFEDHGICVKSCRQSEN